MWMRTKIETESEILRKMEMWREMDMDVSEWAVEMELDMRVKMKIEMQADLDMEMEIEWGWMLTLRWRWKGLKAPQLNDQCESFSFAHWKMQLIAIMDVEAMNQHSLAHLTSTQSILTQPKHNTTPPDSTKSRHRCEINPTQCT